MSGSPKGLWTALASTCRTVSKRPPLASGQHNKNSSRAASYLSTCSSRIAHKARFNAGKHCCSTIDLSGEALNSSCRSAGAHSISSSRRRWCNSSDRSTHEAPWAVFAWALGLSTLATIAPLGPCHGLTTSC
eukprot:3031189-Prymnesium_polylepis.5